MHNQGHIIAGYLDDFILLHDTYEGCAVSVIEAILTFDKLGFAVHPQKSVFIPTQSLVFLGFVINSLTMTLTLTAQKSRNLRTILYIPYRIAEN